MAYNPYCLRSSNKVMAALLGSLTVSGCLLYGIYTHYSKAHSTNPANPPEMVNVNQVTNSLPGGR